MRYIQSYKNYDQEVNEGLKNWVATFLMMANMGLVPAQVVSSTPKEKQEFVEKQPQDKIDAALFAKFLTDKGFDIQKGVPEFRIKSAFSEFSKANTSVKTPLDDMQKYLNKGKSIYSK